MYARGATRGGQAMSMDFVVGFLLGWATTVLAAYLHYGSL